jgi:hypothetical protein
VNRRPVQSSNIAGIGWEADAAGEGAGTLEVEFRSGHVYQYAGVTEAEYRTLLGANSVGKMLNAHIIGRYPEQRLK